MNKTQRQRIVEERQRYDRMVENLATDAVFALAQVLYLSEEKVQKIWDDAA